MIILFIFMLLFCTPANAETYAVLKDDGSVAILEYFENSNDTLEEFVESVGYGEKTLIPINQIQASKKDRKYWKISGSKIVLDETKKQQDIDKEALAESEREAVLQKMKITKEDFEKLK